MFANKLKKLRIESGLTQAQLAQKVGIGASTVGMYESNIRKPSFEVLLKLAIFFNVSIDYLISDEKDDENLRNISHLFESLNKQQKQQVVDFIQFIKNNNRQ